MTLDLVRVEVAGLVSLSEGMMISNARAVISEAAKVWLGSLLFLDSDGHDFDLVVGESDLNFKLVGHNELVSLNRIVVVLLLLSDLVTLLHHLFLHLLHRLFGLGSRLDGDSGIGAVVDLTDGQA